MTGQGLMVYYMLFHQRYDHPAKKRDSANSSSKTSTSNVYAALFAVRRTGFVEEVERCGLRGLFSLFPQAASTAGWKTGRFVFLLCPLLLFVIALPVDERCYARRLNI